MKNLFIQLSVAILSITSLVSCEKKEDILVGSVEFSFSSSTNSQSLKFSESSSNISSALISITDAEGNIIHDKKKIELHSFSDEFISEPVSLIPGNYKLTEFFILDQADSVIYAAPVEGSHLAYLVKNPLALSFGVYKDEVTKITPEVISTEEKRPADFGYAAFGMSIVETFDFLLTIFTYNEDILNYELASANLKISDDSAKVVDVELAAVTNKITLSESYSSYEIIITKPGYMTYRAEFSVDSLKAFWNSPLTVLLEPCGIPMEGLIAYYPFNGNVLDYSAMQNHCIDSTQSVYEEGISGSALYFNGSSDYLTLKNTLDGTHGLSFSFWVNTVNLLEGENNGTIINKYNMYSGQNSFNIVTARWPTNERGLHANYYASSSSTNYRDYAWSELTSPEDVPSQLDNSGLSFLNPTVLETGVWNHCVANITDTEIQVWVNGILCVKRQRTYQSYVDDAFQPTHIGNTLAGGEGSNNHYRGLLDELRIYNRGLTPEEIELLYQER